MRLTRVAPVGVMMLMVILSLTACVSQDAFDEVKQELGEVEEELDDMTDEVDRLRREMAEMERALEEMSDELLESRVDLIGLAPSRKAFIDLSSPEGGYTHVWPESGPGTFLIAFENAETYMEGYRLQIRIGNPMNMTFAGFELRAYSMGGDELKKHSYTQELMPGSWHMVEFIVSPLDERLIMLAIITDQVSLYTR